MRAVFLPGQRQVLLADVPRPAPAHGQVLVRMRASTICESDLRAIYREHLGSGPEAYKGVVAGHEPCGDIVEVGPGCRRFGVGDRVVIYHISGCGLCADCRGGYMISCTSPMRAAYGWQRDGGHAEFLLAEESSCIALPDNLILSGRGLRGLWIRHRLPGPPPGRHMSGRDAVLVTGLDPLGLAAGADDAEGVRQATGGHGCEVSIDCSGSPAGRATALVGEGNRLDVDVSPTLIHAQLTVHGSWVTSVGRMEELVERLVRWDLHPERTVTDRFPLGEAAAAYATADAGLGGKVALVMD